MDYSRNGWTSLPLPPPKPKPNYHTHILLFLMTIVTTIVAGMVMEVLSPLG